jgi:hypothetical protein
MDPHSGIVKLMTASAEIAVCGVWVWVAVCTTGSLGFLTSHTVPFTKRTIWLTKILALIVGAGGVMGALSEIGLAWYFAAVPAATVVFFALRENVEEVVIPTPPRTKASYLPAWENYRRLRRNVLLSYAGIAALFVGVVLASTLESALPAPVEKSIFVFLGLIFLGVLANLYCRFWKFSHWPCPRCGRLFRGLWGFPWLPKRCRYCGLGRWEENPEHDV